MALSQAGAHAGLWPLVGSKTTSVVIALVLVAIERVPLRPGRGAVLALVVATGALDMSANVLFLLASREGLLAVAAVITSLYPASTVALAHLIDHERLHRNQLVGLALVAAAIVLVAS